MAVLQRVKAAELRTRKNILTKEELSKATDRVGFAEHVSVVRRGGFDQAYRVCYPSSRLRYCCHHFLSKLMKLNMSINFDGSSLKVLRHFSVQK